MSKELTKKLSAIQKELKAPKNQKNTFGGYNYRSCEDILEAVKPLLNDLILTISDDITEAGGRFYVRATATISDGEFSISTTALAREAETKKGMDDAQITGAASSYARKYALNGLFAIDDTKDADTQDNTTKSQVTSKQVASKAGSYKDHVKAQQEMIDVLNSATIDDSHSCTECGKAVDKAVESYSKGRFGRVLCRDCQKGAR